MKAITPENGDNKISLKMNEVKRYEVDYSDLEQFVNEVYGIKPDKPSKNYWNDPRYSFVATEECGNDVSIPFTVEPETREEWDDWGKFAKTGHGVSNYSILNDLCNKGWIPAGDYIVHVCW